MYLPYLIPEGHEYQYDLGWMIQKIMAFETELNTAIDLKTIHYADPLQWDITTQYSPNTVVVDPKTGTAYMSKVPVPSGVQLTNTDYWVVVFNYQRIYDKIMSGVAFNDMDNLDASKDIQKYEFVWVGGDLYQAQRDIPQGSKYVPGVNIVPATIAGALEAYYGRNRTAQVVNDTVTVGETQTVTAKNRVLNVAGDQTVTAGDITETSANRTIHTTADYHTDIDGNFSDHVDGVTTVNRGGAVTEVYGNSLDVGVTGPYTAEYRGGATETYAGKRNVTGKDFNYTVNDFKIAFPDNNYSLLAAAKTNPVNVLQLGIDNTGVSPCSELINKYTAMFPLYFPSGKYNIDKPLTIVYPIYGVDAPQGIEWNIEDGINFSLFECNFDTGYLITIDNSSKTANITNIVLVMNNKNVSGIKFSPNSFRSIKITGVSIFGLGDAVGFDLSPSVVTSKGVWMTKCNVYGLANKKSIGAVVSVNCPDCQITNSMFMAVQKGILSYANILYLSDVHIWNGTYLNIGATQEYWTDSTGIYLNNCLLFGTNIYIDTARLAIVNQDGSASRATIDNLIIWYDTSADNVPLTDASLFLDLQHTGKLFINGGYIYSGAKLQYAITDTVSASNLIIATDRNFDNNNHSLFPTYPRVNINRYELLGLLSTTENYTEIYRCWYQWGGVAQVSISDGEGNSVHLSIFKGSAGNSLYKTTIHGSIDLWYKLVNNILIVYAKNPSNDYQVTITECDDELSALIYTLCDKLDRKTGFEREVLPSNSGLTQITEKPA